MRCPKHEGPIIQNWSVQDANSTGFVPGWCRYTLPVIPWKYGRFNIPSIIIYRLLKGETNPSMHQPTNGKRYDRQLLCFWSSEILSHCRAQLVAPMTCGLLCSLKIGRISSAMRWEQLGTWLHKKNAIEIVSFPNWHGNFQVGKLWETWPEGNDFRTTNIDVTRCHWVYLFSAWRSSSWPYLLRIS